MFRKALQLEDIKTHDVRLKVQLTSLTLYKHNAKFSPLPPPHPHLGPKISRKGTHPAGQVVCKKYSSFFDFQSPNLQSIQTESHKTEKIFLPV